MARRIGTCRFSLVAGIHDADLSSQWTDTGQDVEILVAAGGRDAHDIAMELLVCLGQILWERLTPDQSKAYWGLLDAEFQAGIEGEIDDEAFTQKKTLLRNRVTARSRSTLERYARTSFAETAAEYVHSLWHDVSVVTGPEHLPAQQLRRRLELFSLWFRPNRGYRLVARSGSP